MSSASRILVIDDEPNLRNTLSMIFHRAGHTATVAANIEEGRRLLNSGVFDLIFLDLQIPDGYGLDFFQEIRACNDETPVLILTAHATLDSAMNCVRLGARDYLLKPVDPALILARVDEILAETHPPQRRKEIVQEIGSLLEQLKEEVHSTQAGPGAEHTQAGHKPGEKPVRPSPIDPARYLRVGALTLDLHARHATLGESYIPLSPTAFDYLVVLAVHAPTAISAEQLVMEAQGYHASPVEAQELARWRIHELRKALEADTRDPRFIITIRGVGYRLAV